MADETCRVGTPVVVTADGLPSVEGAIRWVRDGEAGIAFNKPIHFDQLTRWLGMRLTDERIDTAGLSGAASGAALPDVGTLDRLRPGGPGSGCSSGPARLYL